MAIAHEDTVLGGANISGDPTPVSPRTLPNQRADLHREVNFRPKPGAQGIKPPPRAPVEKTGSKPTADSPKEKPAEASRPPAPATPSVAHARTNPVAPVDWTKAHQADPHMSRYTQTRVGDAMHALLDPALGPAAAAAAKTDWSYASGVNNSLFDVHAIQQSMHNVWEQNTAQAALMRYVLTGSIKEAVAPSQQGLQGAQMITANALVIGANPINVVAPEKLGLQAALYVAPGIADALASSNPHDSASALTWAALTGTVLGLGHLGPLKGEIRDALSAALGKWPELENTLNALRGASKAHQTRIQDPNVDRAQGWVDKSLTQPVLQNKEWTVRRAGDPTKDVIHQTRDAEGNLIEKSQNKARLAKALKKVGYASRQDLIDAAQKGALSPKQAAAMAKHWQDLGFNYDLKGVTEGELGPLRDPRITVKDAPPEVHARAYTAMTAANHLIQQIHIGPTHNALDPNVSMWRSLIGLGRGTSMAHDGFQAAMLNLAGHLDGNALMKATEGSARVYNSLPHEGKAWVDTMRLVNNEVRIAREDSGYAKNAVGGFMYRLLKKSEAAVKKQGPGGAFASASNKGRTLAATTRTDAAGEAQIVMGQAYKTISESNVAQLTKRARMFGEITDWTKPLPEKYAKDTEALAIRALAAKDSAAALERAKVWTEDRYPEFEQNAHKVLLSGALGRNINAIHRHQAIEHWKNQKITEKDGTVVPAAIQSGVGDPAMTKQMIQRGYREALPTNGPGVLFHPDIADLIDKATSSKAAAKLPGALDAMGEIERNAVGRIMYSPAIHGMNMAGRMLIFSGMHLLTHPGVYAQGMKKAGQLTQAGAEEAAHASRMEAFNAGVISHGHRNTMPDALRQMSNALDESEMYKIPVDGVHEALPMLGKPQMNPFQQVNKWFWSRVDDFAVTAFHIEKDAAMADGMSLEQATNWARSRANSWAGYVAKEDVRHPLVYDMARTVFFAPAFWKTWSEIFAPFYHDSGVALTRPMALHIAKQEVAVVASAYMMQQLTGNGLNLVMSGKPQFNNQQQNKHRVEITRPEIIRAMQAAHYPGAAAINPDTGLGPNGEVLTMEDPFSRFQKDMEGVAGLDSGKTDWQPSDAGDGISKFMVSRLSPFLDATAALANVDLYRAATSHLRQNAVDPSQPALTLPSDETRVLAALAYMVPGGSQFLQANRANAGKKQEQGSYDFLGLHPPKGMVDAAGATAESLLLTGLTGVNAPYATHTTTRGEIPTDQDYAAVNQLKSEHDKEMAAWSAMTLGGERTPAQWLAHYHSATQTYHDRLGEHFNNAPAYANGPQALVSEWEATYEKATDPTTKELDPAKLDKLQADFTRAHGGDGSADMNALHNELSKNDQANPMLGVYHKTMDAYRNWQTTWAQTNNVDINTLRADIREYGASYGDPATSSLFLRTHRDVALYERAKKAEFERSPAGLAYGLFYNSTMVANYMRAYHLTDQQVIQQEQAQP